MKSLANCYIILNNDTTIAMTFSAQPRKNSHPPTNMDATGAHQEQWPTDVANYTKASEYQFVRNSP